MTIDEFNNVKINDIVVYNMRKYSFFTYEKFYNVLDIDNHFRYFEIKCDGNVILSCNYSYFTTLEKYSMIQRKRKLKKLFK